MSNNTVERGIPEIVPSDGKNFAYIDSKELDRAKEKLAEPITVQIFGGSIDGKIFVVRSGKQEAPQHHRRRSFKKRNRKYTQSEDNLISHKQEK
jgi:hypothetical protein